MLKNVKKCWKMLKKCKKMLKRLKNVKMPKMSGNVKKCY